MRPVLMIAEKFPPHAVSGAIRPFFFARHLPEFGYRPIVLTSPLLPGDRSDLEMLSALPAEVEVVSAFRTLVAARAALTGSAVPAAKQPRGTPLTPARGDRTTARPSLRDRAASRLATIGRTAAWLTYWHLDWLPSAFARGVRLARRRGAQLVWVTAPHMKNLILGYAIARALNLKLVVDLRDPWTYGGLWQPISSLAENVERGWARRILGAASRIIFTSPLTQRQMEARFPAARGKCTTITNGYSADEAAIEPLRDAPSGKFLLRHIGTLNRRRTPDVLLQALQWAVDRQPALQSDILLEFVGEMGGNEARIADFEIASCVSVRGPVSRADSLALMRGADANVLLQTVSSGSDVIAGKTFDYLASERPVLAAVDPSGGDAWLLERFEGVAMSHCSDVPALAGAIAALHARWRVGTLPTVEGNLAAYERRHLSQLLARELDDVVMPCAAS
jgi:glycosyltransferase involved in cell wall biosynthesis